MVYRAIPHLINSILCVKEGDVCTFIYDSLFCELCSSIMRECEASSANYNDLMIEFDGVNIPEEAANLLTNDSHNVFVFGLSTAGIWHSDERKQAKYKLAKRLANFVCSPNLLINEVANASPLSKNLGETIHSLLKNGNYIRITTDLGTELEAMINRKASLDPKYAPFLEAGDFCYPGSGGDYPCGEVGFGPDESSVNGKIIFDYKFQHVGFLIDPVEVIIDRDKIISIKGDGEDTHKLSSIIESHSAFEYLCEISLGLNPFIKDDKDINFIPEEKKLSTCHFGFGGNLSYGDRKGPHIDGVINKPTLVVDDITIIRSGLFNKEILDGETYAWLSSLALA
jgi:leucyl aminopeptidase (aminopeptidase T)